MSLLNPVNYLGYLGYIPRKILGFPNLLIDRKVHALPFNEVKNLPVTRIDTLQLGDGGLRDWVERYGAEYVTDFGDHRYYKLMELHASFKVLDPKPEDRFMDAAGGKYTYLHHLPCRRRVIQDMKFDRSVKAVVGQDVEYIECSAAAIPLPDGSLDRISCHHSFEHFQGDADVSFVREVQRLLAPGGRCCILPIFLSDCYAEITDTWALSRKFDARSRRVVDPTATLPGSVFSGSYARVYDPRAFQERVLSVIDPEQFHVELLELRFDGATVPDLSLPCHRYVSAVNHPNRALVIGRKD